MFTINTWHRRLLRRGIYLSGFFFIDAKTDVDFRYNYGCVDLHIERMTLAGPQARARCSACDGKRWPRAQPFSVVSEEYRCHMRCLSCMMHVRLVGYTKKEKQQLDMNVCVQTNESKGRCVCGKMTGGGELFLLRSFSPGWPRVWVLRCEAGTHRWAAVFLSVAPLALSLSGFLLPIQLIQCSFIHLNNSIQDFQFKTFKEPVFAASSDGVIFFFSL